MFLELRNHHYKRYKTCGRSKRSKSITDITSLKGERWQQPYVSALSEDLSNEYRLSELSTRLKMKCVPLYFFIQFFYSDPDTSVWRSKNNRHTYESGTLDIKVMLQLCLDWSWYYHLEYSLWNRTTGMSWNHRGSQETIDHIVVEVPLFQPCFGSLQTFFFLLKKMHLILFNCSRFGAE